MTFEATQGAGALLAALVKTANLAGDASTLLHDEVVLHRLDGTALAGREAVVDAISTRGSEAQLTMMGSYGEAIHVALMIEGLPGHLLFMMSGTVREGRLVEIWME
jgi:hypothetical protein